MYSYGEYEENWFLTIFDEGSYASFEEDHIIIGDKGYCNFRFKYQPEEEEEFIFYPPFIPSHTYTKMTITYDASGAASSALAIIDMATLDMINYKDLDLTEGEGTETIDLFDEVEDPGLDFSIAILAYSNRELKIYEIILHN